MSATIDIAKLSHDARILSMDADGNYTSAEVDYIVTFKDSNGSPYKDNNTAIDSGLEELALDKVRELAKLESIKNIELKSVTIRERLAPAAFRVTATHGEKDENGSESGGGGSNTSQESTPEMSFECSAQSKHVEVAMEQKVVKTFAPNRIPEGSSLGNLIGWNAKYGDDCDIKGCDTPTGTSIETWTKTMSYSSISTAKKIKWGETVGCVNSAPWKGWPARCAMFLGASFQKETGNRKVAVTFQFAVGAPKETVVFEGQKIEIRKSPFDYIWAVQAQKKTSDGNHTLPATAAVVVSKVAQEADFSVLGI